jgi:hypothetical protein
MFGSISPSRGRRSAATRRLWLEVLEGRDCPSTFVPGNTSIDLFGAYKMQQGANQYAAQYVLNLQCTVLSGPSVEFTGSVTAGANSNVANQVVEFQGAISGYVVTDSSGNFDFITNAPCPASVDAAVIPEAVGGDGTMMPMPGPVESNVLQEMLAANATQITMTITKTSPYQYEITGKVTGSSVDGLKVTFGGQPQSIQGQTAIVNPDGTFQLFIEMDHGANDEGWVTAQILSDANGQKSNVAYGLVLDVGQ